MTRDGRRRPVWYDEVNERRVALAARRIIEPDRQADVPRCPRRRPGVGRHGHWSVEDRVQFIAEIRRQVSGRLPNSGTDPPARNIAASSHGLYACDTIA